MTAFQAEGCGGGFAADYKKGGAAGAAGCIEGLHRFAQGATAPAALRVVVSSSRAISIIMPPFGGHVHIKYHNHSYPRTSLRHFVALFP